MVQNGDNAMKYSLFNDKLPTLYEDSCHLFYNVSRGFTYILLTIQKYGSIQWFRYVVVGCFVFTSVGGHGGWFSTWWRWSRRFSNESDRPVVDQLKHLLVKLLVCYTIIRGRYSLQYATLHVNCWVAVLIVC